MVLIFLCKDYFKLLLVICSQITKKYFVLELCGYNYFLFRYQRMR